jgi:hypothetical protein
MPFIKPYNYVDGTILSNTDQFLNEEGSKEYINQEISSVDYALTNFDYDEIEPGEFQPITNNHKFCTSYIAGKNIGIGSQNNLCYFTSNIKANNEQGTSISWFDLWGTGEQVNIVEGSAKVIITFEGAFIGENNNISTGGGVITNGLWDNKILLRHTDYTSSPSVTTFIDGTRMWGFEGTGPSLGAVNPNAIGAGADRRQIMLQYLITLDRGIHDLQLCINPKIQFGAISARNFLVEVFYL